MKSAWLFIGAAVLLFSLTSIATAQAAPVAPSALVADVVSAGFGDAWVHFAFYLSPDDPDQTNGSFDYYVWWDDTRVEPSLNDLVTLFPVPNRPGWVSTGQMFVEYGTTPVSTFYISANDSSLESPRSCGAEIDMRLLGAIQSNVPYPSSVNGHGQCGAPQIQPPAGMSAFVHEPVQNNEAGEVELRMRVSPDDPDQEAGDFRYNLFGDAWWSDELVGYFLFASASGVDGIRNATLTFSGQAASVRQFRVIAEDLNTLQRSEWSCTAIINNGIIYDSYACGAISPLAGGPVPGAPTFPFLDVSATAAAAGMSVGLVGGILAVGAVVGLAVMGFLAAGLVGGLALGAVALGFVALLGLMPLYVLVVVFLACVSIVIFRFKAGGGE